MSTMITEVCRWEGLVGFGKESFEQRKHPCSSKAPTEPLGCGAAALNLECLGFSCGCYILWLTSWTQTTLFFFLRHCSPGLKFASNRGWPWTFDSPASMSKVQVLWARTTTPFFWWCWVIEPRASCMWSKHSTNRIISLAKLISLSLIYMNNSMK